MSTETQTWTRSNETWLRWTDKAADLCVAMEDAMPRRPSANLRQAQHEYLAVARYAEIPKNHRCLAFLCQAIAEAGGSDKKTMMELLESIVGHEIAAAGVMTDPLFWNRGYDTVMAELAFLESWRSGNQPISILEKRRAMVQQDQTEANEIAEGRR